eukprot:scaffold31161_cov56-Attheya_sp.AAC.3
MTGTATIVSLILLCTTFQNRQRITIRKDKKKKSAKRAAIDEEASRILPVIGISIYDCCIAGCLLLNVTTKGSIASFETMGVVWALPWQTRILQNRSSTTLLIVGGMLVMSTGVALWTTLDSDGSNQPWKYVVTIVLIYSFGYPVGHTAVIGLFSKSK